MESDSSCGDLTHNEELPIKLEETSISINKEDDQSDVVSLRLLDLTDVDDFMEWFTDDNVNKFCSDDNSFMSKEAAMRYIADVVVPHPWFRAICLNGKPIGSISVLPFHGSDSCRGEIGYELSSKYWGKGIATKAVKMVASTIFFEWPHLERLEAAVAVDNLRSQRVLEKAGFVKEELPIKLEETSKSSNKEDDQSDVISLRLLDLTDVDEVMEWTNDDNVNKFYPQDSTLMSKEATMRYIADVVVPHPWFRAICLDGKPIGSISVSPFRGRDSFRGEVGYELSSKYWGKGIATKVVKMVASTIFFEWPHLERLEAKVDVDNLGSQRVLEKAGFVKEGVLKKYYLFRGKPKDIMFSLLSTDQQLTYFD